MTPETIITTGNFSFRNFTPRVWCCENLPHPVSASIYLFDNWQFQANVWDGKIWHHSTKHDNEMAAATSARHLLASIGIHDPLPDHRLHEFYAAGLAGLKAEKAAEGATTEGLDDRMRKAFGLHPEPRKYDSSVPFRNYNPLERIATALESIAASVIELAYRG